METNRDSSMRKVWESLNNEEKTVFAVGVWRAAIEGKNKFETMDENGHLVGMTPSGEELGKWLKGSGKLKAILDLKEETGLPFFRCVEIIG